MGKNNNADYKMQTIGKNEMLVADIQEAWRKGLNADNFIMQLYNDNMYLLRKWCNPFARFYGHDLEDLLQESYFAILSAIKSYSADSGFKFSSFLKYHIFNYVCRYLANNGIPHNAQDDIKKYNHALAELSQTLNRTPTPEEIADFSGISKKRQIQLYCFINQNISLDAPLTEEDGNADSFKDMIPSDDIMEDSILSQLERTDEIKEIMQGLNQMPKRTKDIVLKSIVYEQSLESLGKEYNISNSRVQQIRDDALKKLNKKCSHIIAYDSSLDGQMYENGYQRYKYKGSNVENMALKKMENADSYNRLIDRYIATKQIKLRGIHQKAN